jgi:hypothetical protein
MGKGSGRRPAAVDDATLTANWERTFPRRRNVKIYHFHLSAHEEIPAETEVEALQELHDRWPFDANRFELTYVLDVPAPFNPTDNACGRG